MPFVKFVLDFMEDSFYQNQCTNGYTNLNQPLFCYTKMKKIESSELWFHIQFYYILLYNVFTVKFKDPLSCLRQFVATESPLKMMKEAFYFILKVF